MPPRRVLVAFVDALGPDALERWGGAFDSLPHRASLEGVLGYSSGALATVLTGSMPAVHGRMCLFARREPGAPALLAPLRWLGVLPRVIHERRRVRAIAGRWLAWSRGLTGYVALHRVPPRELGWLDLPERDDLFQAESIGGSRTFLADARAAGLRVHASPWQREERARLAATEAALRRDPPDLALLYAAELDATLHRHGPEGDHGEAVLARIATHVMRARDALAQGGAEVITIVVGDHGMARVRSTVDPRAVERRLRAAGARAFVDSTMLRLHGDADALARARRLVADAGWPARWLDAGALATHEASTRYGDAIVLLDEGVIFAPSWVGGRVDGMHGYHPAAPSARAAIASSAPLGGARRLADVAGRVRAALGLGGAAVPVADPAVLGPSP